MAFSVEEVDEFLQYAVFHNVVVLLYRARLTPLYVDLIGRLLLELGADRPHGVVVVTMPAPGVTASSAALAGPLRDLDRRLGGSLRLFVPFVDAQSTFAAARVAFWRGLALLLGPKQLRLAQSIEEAAFEAAHAARTDDGVPVDEPALCEFLRFCDARHRQAGG